ncbi:Rgg/GadR/MutR family transcriptional regulator [Lactococcus protaetiae]|uniref:HTH cro/C1-type domain-containing protein n=1 Tax=Lactococcus protaetiae TaxID=2592653 RepID=A0A514Z5U6_9LACT|nr:Rgg/GadR/MutR family transcriptional regulator [Lactococcus protaetiae]QDK69951.1 hypothetical protein FLP15_00660 [Lactococcus protaetiae]
MNNGFGKTFHEIRLSKRLSMDKVGGKEVSKAQISRFEAGTSELTIEKFFILLENMRVGIDEFESILEDYTLSNEYKFRQELIMAYDAKDAHKLRKMYHECEEKVKKEPDDIYHKLTATVVKVTLNLVVKNLRFSSREIEQIQEYLLSVDNWGRYEFWVFGNTVTILKDSVLRLLGTAALGKTEFYQILPNNKRLAIRTFYNLAYIALERGNLELSLKYIKHLDTMDISIDYLYEKLLIKYIKGWYAHKKGLPRGSKEMLECVEMLEELGCRDKARELREEITSILRFSDM